jgi:hypothetical protein
MQRTVFPHLGNILGAIIPAIAMAQDPKNESFIIALLGFMTILFEVIICPCNIDFVET